MFPLILQLVLNLVAAGHETAASALQWATYAMVKYPEAQEQLRAEVLSMLKRTPMPGYSEIEGLRYMNNFYREVLRLWCPGTEYPNAFKFAIFLHHALKPLTLLTI